MQPYLFPYIGYFQLISHADKWVFFDVVQYQKRSWMNRNRILHPTKINGCQYISVPIRRHKRGTLIKDVSINREINWKQDILGKLTVYRRMRAAYFDDVIDLLTSIFDPNPANFIDLSVLSTRKICKYIGIDFNYEIASNINFDRSLIDGPGDWALSITKELGGSVYVNPPGGFNIFDEDKFKKNGIDLLFLKPNLSPYRQSKRVAFLPGFSIIDLLMFNGTSEIRDLITDDFSLCRKEQLINEEILK